MDRKTLDASIMKPVWKEVDDPAPGDDRAIASSAYRIVDTPSIRSIPTALLSADYHLDIWRMMAVSAAEQRR
jgi:hypothetical protein